MPRQQTYGKQARVVYSTVTLSSPDQPSTNQPKSEKVQGIPIKANQARKRTTTTKDARGVERKALGERNHNVVIEPVEALQHVQEPRESVKGSPKIPRAISPKKPTKLVFNEDDDGYVVAFSKEPIKPVSLKVQQDVSTTPRPRQQRRPAARPRSRGEDNRHNTSTRKAHERRPPSISRTECPYEKHCRALLDLSQHPLTCFNAWSCQLSEHFAVTKIAEASFGEVYRLSLHKAIPCFSSSDESVFKVIPLKPVDDLLPKEKRKRAAALKKAEFQSKPQDVANEVKLLQRMSAIPGFTNFRDVRILQGRPPEAFIDAFQAWNTAQKAKKKDLSHFPDPTKKGGYTDDQLWAVIEMQDAGTDLERLVEDGACTSIWSTWDIFWQVVLSLAKGEESAEFEHRDLHMGNICIRFPSTIIPPHIDTKRKLNFTGSETTIIDYTISRCAMINGSTAYTDLSLDSALFEGDSTEEYQYDIYRYMRSALFFDDALADFHARAEDVERSERHWEQYHPQTNLVWLHLVLYKLLHQVTWPSETKMPNRKTEKEEYRCWKRANDLEHILLKVQELLYPETICGNDIWSAGDLVLFALQEGWLDVEDVSGHGAGDESALISQLEGLEL